MSVLEEQCHKGVRGVCGGGSSSHDCAEGHSMRKVGQEKKGKLRGEALAISHISLWNIISREVAGMLTPL